MVLSAADPLNLVGILTPEARVASIPRNRILLQDGVPVAALEAGEVRRLAASPIEDDALKGLLVRRSLRQPLKPWHRATTLHSA